VGYSGRLKSLLQEYLEFLCREHPEIATFSLGIHTYDDELSDPSLEGVKRRIQGLERFVELFSEIDASELSREEKWDLEIVRSALAREIYSIEEIGMWRKYPDYVMQICVAIDPPYSRDYPDFDHRTRCLCARLEKTPHFLESSKTAMTDPVKTYVEIALQGMSGAQGFLNTVAQHMIPLLTSDLQDRMRSAIAKVSESIHAYENYLRNDVLPRSEPQFAYGQERFDKMLKLMGLEMDATELIRLAENSLAHSSILIGRTASKLVPSGDWKEALRKVSEDRPTDWPETLRLCKQTVHQLRALTIEKGIATLPPTDSLEVLETPDYWRHVSQFLASYLRPPPFHRDQTGRFYITPITDPKMLKSRADIYLTCLHETYPGHHLHLAWSNANPSLARKLFSNLPLTEGWAHYMEEYWMTQITPDPKVELVYLQQAMRRAARAILCAKLHTEQLTIGQAAEFLVDKVGLEPQVAESEARMYALTPFQYLSHFAGKQSILRLREEVKQVMGSRYTDRFFHDILLRSGRGVSFNILKEMLHEAMAE